MLTRSIICVFILLFSISAFAQPAGYELVKDNANVKSALTLANKNIKNISCDFKQVKKMTLLEDKITSKGNFYFAKEFKVRIQYTHPYSYLLVMNGNKMLVKDEEKTNKINTGSSKMLQSVNRLMADCIQGTVFNNTDFNVSVYKADNVYLLWMLPITADLKKLFNTVEVYLDSKTMNVNKLVMTEEGGDYTSMEFFNIKHNETLSEALFSVK